MSRPRPTAMKPPRPIARAISGCSRWARSGVVFGDIGTSPLYALAGLPVACRRRPASPRPDRRRGFADRLGADRHRHRQIRPVPDAGRQQGRGRHPFADGPGANRARQAHAADFLSRRRRLGAVFRRRDHHAGDFRALGGGGAQSAFAQPRPVHPAGDHRHPDPAVPRPEPRHGGHFRAVRSGDDRVLPVHRRARRDPYRRGLGRAARAEPDPRPRLPARPWRDRLRRPRQRVPGGHRRRGALRRHGPFRPRADPDRLDRPGSAGADPQLPRPGRAYHRRRAGGRESLSITSPRPGR